MKKAELQPIKSAKTGHETVVNKASFESHKKLYAPYVAVTWEELESFELVEKAEAVVKAKASETIAEKVEESKKESSSKSENKSDKKPDSKNN